MYVTNENSLLHCTESNIEFLSSAQLFWCLNCHSLFFLFHFCRSISDHGERCRQKKRLKFIFLNVFLCSSSYLTSTSNSEHTIKFSNEKIEFYPSNSYSYFHFRYEIGK